MARWKMFCWLGLVAFGLTGGLIVGGLWPRTPLHAVATDRIDTFGMATGSVDNDVEALYFLDFLTGELNAVVLGKNPGSWTGYYAANVAADLGVDPQKNPKYMMVTGVAYLRRAGGSRLQPSSSICYVAEVTSGKVAAYSVPWSPSMYAAGQVQKCPLVLVGVTRFRASLGVGPGTTDGGPQKMPWR